MSRTGRTETGRILHTLAPSFISTGAFGLPAGSRDAALLTTLPAGSYTVQVRGADGARRLAALSTEP